MIAPAQDLLLMPLEPAQLHVRMIQPVEHPKLDFETLLEPETPLESLFLSLSEFKEGYQWGKPRYGHPEGKVGLHVREVLDNVERLRTDAPTRQHLRLVSIIHDTFKFKEKQLQEQGEWRHHGRIAREFVTSLNLFPEPHLLDLIELHDEAYYIWRGFKVFQQPVEARHRLDTLLERLGKNLPLYYLFFKCDTETGDKNQLPLRWFERQFPKVVGEFC